MCNFVFVQPKKRFPEFSGHTRLPRPVHPPATSVAFYLLLPSPMDDRNMQKDAQRGSNTPQQAKEPGFDKQDDMQKRTDAQRDMDKR